MAEEEAAVVLSAQDEVSGAVAGAVASLERLKSTVVGSSSAMVDLTYGGTKATEAVVRMGEAAERAEVPHRALHQSMNLLSRELVDVAGGSRAAEGAVHVLDSVMLAAVTSGGALSTAFLVFIGVAVTVGTVIKTVSENTEKAKKEFEGAVESVRAITRTTEEATAATVDHAKAILKQYEAQLLVAEQAPNLGAKVKAAMGDIETAAKAAFDQVAKVAEAIIHPLTAVQALAGATSATMTGVAADISKPAPEIDALKKKVHELQEALDGIGAAARKSAAELDEFYMRQLEEAADAARVEMDLEDAKRERELFIQQARLGGWGAYYSQKDGMNQRANAAQDAEDEAAARAAEARRMKDLTNAVNTAASAAAAIGAATASAAMGASDAWHVAVSAIINDIVRMATRWVEEQVVMAQTAAFAQSVFTHGFLGIIEGLAAIGAIAAIGATLQAAASSGTSGAGVGGGVGVPTNAAGSPATAASTGFGGAAVSSAQQSVNNNISVQLAVEALDLSTVSDSQMRSLANRVARLIAGNATGGQLTLAGAS